MQSTHSGWWENYNDGMAVQRALISFDRPLHVPVAPPETKGFGQQNHPPLMLKVWSLLLRWLAPLSIVAILISVL